MIYQNTKSDITKYMTSISNKYILINQIIQLMNTLIHIIKTTDDKSSTYINFDIEKNDEDSKVKDDDHIKIPKNKNVFPNGYNPTWSEEFFVIKKV